ncbi:hypothetical protein BSG1_09001 [Bacillus sp. SG-1]|nr:hypothetical protein BSG1_09001 [Bacillus sp. SG-1]
MFWLTMILCLYLAYYSLRYARLIWKDQNKLGAVMVGMLACIISIMPLLNLWLLEYK